jgi:oxygen-independent coproporphyrinogen-3 oxidase
MPPLAIYIHWPFCKSKCPYCDFNSHVRDSVDQERWRAALLRELDYTAAQIGEYEVGSIFFGGGTPSLMPPATAAALIDRVHDLWPVADDVEITLEANPTSVETSTFADFQRAGINRVSLGVQSLDSEALQFLGRGHSVDEALHAIDLARNTFQRYSFDLIYARPQQTLAAWEAELAQAMRYVGSHMSLYQLTIEENTAFHHAYAKGGFTLPDEAESEALYRLTESVLAAQGLAAYEVSNYAKPGEESRHNMAYWKGQDYIGIGPGAHGRITVKRQRTATQTIKSPERWLEKVERDGNGLEVWQSVERQQEVEERVMMGLRLAEGISYQDFEEQTGYDLRPYLNASRCEFYRAKGLLADDPTRLQTTLNGRLVLGTLTGELLN